MVKFASAVFVAPILISLLILGCTQTPPPPVAQGAYFETVREIILESKQESIEYLMTDEGLILRKMRVGVAGTPNAETQVAIFRIGPAFARAFLDDVKANAVPIHASCIPCVSHHLFYHDADGTIAYEMPDENASGFVKALAGRMETLIEGAQKQETFFMALVYSENSVIKDYHIFDDGTIIYEEFDMFSDKLTRAEISKMEPWELKAALPEAFFEGTPEFSCNSRAFGYGYVEAALADKYNFVYTCGNGPTQADKLFDRLLALVGNK
ncbi:MAG: hypothetical protein ABH863_01425 [Candidatus Micrarchaeota archaeon]